MCKKEKKRKERKNKLVQTKDHSLSSSAMLQNSSLCLPEARVYYNLNLCIAFWRKSVSASSSPSVCILFCNLIISSNLYFLPFSLLNFCWLSLPFGSLLLQKGYGKALLLFSLPWKAAFLSYKVVAFVVYCSAE